MKLKSMENLLFLQKLKSPVNGETETIILTAQTTTARTKRRKEGAPMIKAIIEAHYSKRDMVRELLLVFEIHGHNDRQDHRRRTHRRREQHQRNRPGNGI